MAAVIRRLLLCCVAGSLLFACSGDESSSNSTTTSTTAPACAAEVAYPIDPGSGQHILPGSPEPTYNTDPPTSGAHAPGNHPSGALAEPIARPVQVGMLEGGHVLVQFRDAGLREALAPFASPKGGVTVAPNPSMDAPIVVTAWLYSMRCQRVEGTAIDAFITAHLGKNPGH